MNNKWQELSTKILAALDIAAEYAGLGLRIPPNRNSTGAGWLACHAMGREDRSPSAAINVGQGPLRGRYVDRGGEGISLTLWDFAARFGPYKDWQDARKAFGKKAGMTSRFPKEDEERQVDRVELLPEMPDGRFALTVAGLCRAYPPATPEAIRLCGGRIGVYPRKSASPRYVVAFPVFGPQLLDGGLQGYVIQACDGGKIQLFRGEGHPPEPVKRLTLGSTGMVGLHGLKHIEQAERVYKVAGISDMLTLQSIIPPELRDKHVVVSNSCGETEKYLPRAVASIFAGREVVLVQDADEAGETGRGVWVEALQPLVGKLLNWRLPFPVTKKKGKDLRDFITESA